MNSHNRTKKLLWTTLYTLIKKEKIPFDSITINQLCQEALLHRTTFYKHFDDKYALLQFGYQLLCAERQAFPVYKRVFEPFSLSEKLEQRHYFHTAYELASTTPYLQQLFQKMMYSTIENDLEELEIFPHHLPKHLLITHISSTLANLDLFWRTNASQLSASEIDDSFKLLIASFLNTSAKNSNSYY